MQEVKRIFHEKYQECEITQRQDYQLGTIAKPIVYSVDCIFNEVARVGGSRCDEFIFFNLDPASTGVYLLERKDNNSNDVNKVSEQLQGGAVFIEDFLDHDPATDNQPFDFMPIWVSKGIRASMRRELVNIRISLRNIQKSIRHIRTKDTLPKLS